MESQLRCEILDAIRSNEISIDTVIIPPVDVIVPKDNGFKVVETEKIGEIT